MHYQLQKWKDILSTSTKQLNSLHLLPASEKDIKVLTRYYQHRMRFARGRIEALRFKGKTTILERSATHNINVVDATIL